MKIITKDGSVTLDFAAETARRCGGCELCCKLLPIRTLEKGGNTRCRHQQHAKGCRIYASRPLECQSWSCRWLAAPEETAGMARPDRAHYTIDPLFDTVRLVPDAGPPIEIEAVQVWCDPAFPAVKTDPKLRAYMLTMAEKHGVPTLLRWSTRVATAVFPPPLNADGEWIEQTSQCNEEIGLFSKLPPGLRPPA